MQSFARLAGRSFTGRQSRRRLTAYLVVFLSGFTFGCYTYTPIAQSPAPGTHVRLGLNDKGRVGLGTSIGPTGASIEGTVQSSSDSALALKVENVTYLNGQLNMWNGEPLVVSKDFIGTTEKKEFSQGRSLLVGAGVIGAAVLFVITRQLIGSGSENVSNTPGKPKGS